MLSSAAPGGGIPVGGAEARERGHDRDAAVVRHARREGLDVGGAGNQPEAVAEPLNDRAPHEDASLEGVLGAAADAPGDG